LGWTRKYLLLGQKLYPPGVKKVGTQEMGVHPKMKRGIVVGVAIETGEEDCRNKDGT